MGFIENIVKFMNISDEEYFDEYDDCSENIKREHLLGYPIDDEEEMVLRKIKLGEMLNVEDMRILVEITLNEFKKTFGNVDDDMEIVFRKKKTIIDTKDKKVKSKTESDKNER